MYKVPRAYRVSYDLKHGVKQHREHHEMEVDCFSQREAIAIVRGEALRMWGKHAFHCEARRVGA